MMYSLKYKSHWRQTVFAVMAGFAALLTASCNGRPDEVTLTVLYTTDVNGRVLPYDFSLNEKAKTSMVNISSYIKQVRQENPGGVILLDAGNMCGVQPSSYYYNYIETQSEHIVPAVYNYLQYDAVGLGATDIELGPKIYKERLPREYKMPVVCANFVYEDTDEPVFNPYVILERQRVKIAVLGLTRPDLDTWIPRQLYAGMDTRPMVETAQKWVKIIQEKEHPDVIIGLFHSGAGVPEHNIPGKDNDNDNNGLASVPTGMQAPGISLVLMGQDHRKFEGQFENVKGETFAALEALSDCLEIGRAELHLRLLANGNYDVQVKTQIVSMEDQPIDTELAAKFADIPPRVNDYLDHPLGDIPDTLYAIDALMGPSRMTDLIHNMQLDISKAQVSLANFSAIRNIPSGRITTRDLFSLYQYNNQLYTLKMTGEELEQFLEFGYSRQYNQMTAGTDHLLRFVYDKQGYVKRSALGPELFTPPYHYTSAAGIKYVVDVRKPYGDRVEILSMSDGTPFRPKDTLIVAMNSHQVAGGGRFLTQGLGWSKEMTQKRIVSSDVSDLRTSFANYIRTNYMMKTDLRNDWKVIPVDWFNHAKAIDTKFLGPRFDFSN